MAMLRDLVEQVLDEMVDKVAKRQGAERAAKFAALVADVKAYSPPMPTGYERADMLCAEIDRGG